MYAVPRGDLSARAPLSTASPASRVRTRVKGLGGLSCVAAQSEVTARSFAETCDTRQAAEALVAEERVALAA